MTPPLLGAPKLRRSTVSIKGLSGPFEVRQASIAERLKYYDDRGADMKAATAWLISTCCVEPVSLQQARELVDDVDPNFLYPVLQAILNPAAEKNGEAPTAS